jgi:AcrR family transcriptional regulator
MTPRPRTIDDAAILDAAGRIISRHGPAKFTLADIAGEVGLSAATLVQRFGSKRGLMLALARSARDSVDACFIMVRTSNPSPLAAVLAAGTEMTRYVKSPEEMSNHLAFLQTDLSDPDFYAVMLENSRRIIAGYRRLLDEAVAARELVPCDTARLARAVDALAGGSLIGWAVYRDGTAETWVRHDLNTLLEPYRPKAKARVSSRSSRAQSKKAARRRRHVSAE